MNEQELMLLNIERNFQPSGPPPEQYARSSTEDESLDLQTTASASEECVSAVLSPGKLDPTNFHILRSSNQLRRIQDVQKSALGYWRKTDHKRSNNEFLSAAKFESGASVNKKVEKVRTCPSMDVASTGVTNKFRRIIRNYVDGEKR
jgi:hypothetical protein